MNAKVKYLNKIIASLFLTLIIAFTLTGCFGTKLYEKVDGVRFSIDKHYSLTIYQGGLWTTYEVTIRNENDHEMTFYELDFSLKSYNGIYKGVQLRETNPSKILEYLTVPANKSKKIDILFEGDNSGDYLLYKQKAVVEIKP